ncbi:bifunctional adenosylcobinamide kinase/adenosylcobinamide-phosphate guanylyltransferase [Candidatus Poriferisodalis sp.]|uniref:bifunctional adenosylcobinamide kinase/adenosylcobinamide-phosphate guanylyltransferase n=1 Tax=Candidatus Poriferisodalis sp. TaxID=3101277 RepID=UPI003B013E35
MLIAFTGGARSGKSTAALSAATSTGAPVTFIATAEAGDDEMTERIERHRADRPAVWATIEAPIHLAQAVEQVDAEATIVVDCLSMWVSNRMLAERAAVETEPGSESGTGERLSTDSARAVVAEAGDLGERLRERSGTAIVVTNEVGSGVVPATPLGRAYRDVLGSVNQAIFAAADRAYLVVAGRLLELQGPSDGA